MHKLSFSLAMLTAAFVLVSPSEGQAETTGPDPLSHVYITAPTPNTYFPDAPALFDTHVSVAQGEFEAVINVELFADGVSLGTQECLEGCTFVGVQLEAGVHELRATGDSGAFDTTTVYVVEAPPEPSDTTGDTGDTTDGGSESDTNGDELGDDTGTSGDEDDSVPGSGCEVDATPSPWGLLALPALLLIPAIRRRD